MISVAGVLLAVPTGGASPFSYISLWRILSDSPCEKHALSPEKAGHAAPMHGGSKLKSIWLSGTEVCPSSYRAIAIVHGGGVHSNVCAPRQSATRRSTNVPVYVSDSRCLVHLHLPKSELRPACGFVQMACIVWASSLVTRQVSALHFLPSTRDRAQ